MLSRHVLAITAATFLFAGAAYAQDTTAPPEQPRGEVNQRIENQKDRQENSGTPNKAKKRRNRKLRRNRRKIHRARHHNRAPRGT